MAGKTAPGRRTAILDSAARLFASQGVERTSVREISASVGILSGSLYHHFVSKDEMVEEILRSFLDDLQGRYRNVIGLRLDPRATIESLIRVTFEIMRDHPNATQIYQDEVSYIQRLPKATGTREISSEIAGIWVDAIESGIATGVFRKNLDAPVVHRLLRDSLWLTARWFKPSSKYSLDRLIGDFITLFLDGLVA